MLPGGLLLHAVNNNKMLLVYNNIQDYICNLGKKQQQQLSVFIQILAVQKVRKVLLN